MAKNGPNKKILIVADLDYTHFDQNKEDVVWIGNKIFWVSLYSEISKIASEKNIDVLFAIVTHKEDFDDICEVAAHAFQPFLENHNPHMFIKRQNKPWWLWNWCLVNIHGKLQYQCLVDNSQD